MENQEQIASQKLQVKCHQFLYSISDELTKPEKKFLKEMVFGIIGAGNTTIRQVSKTVDDKIQFKSICTRLYRNIQKQEFHYKLQTNLLKKQCRGLTSDSLILVDDSDISKDYANKMEGLSTVRDGSKKCLKKGYNILNFVALKQTDEGYELRPLLSELYSKDKEEDSLSNLTQDYINDITLYSYNRGIFVFDRGGDAKHNLSTLSNNNNSYIIRSTGKRNVIYNGIEMNIKSICKKMKLSYEIKSNRNTGVFKAGVKRVHVLVGDHPSSKSEYIETNLVVVRYKNTENSFFYFLCDFPTQKLTDAEIIDKTMVYYRLRWKIEELHREVKVNYKWEDMQLLSYSGLKNLNAILFIAVSFVYSLKRIVIDLLKAMPNFIIDKKSDVEKIHEFLYYRLFELAKYCFSKLRKYNKTKTYKPKNNNELLLGLTMEEKM